MKTSILIEIYPGFALLLSSGNKEGLERSGNGDLTEIARPHTVPGGHEAERDEGQSPGG